MMIELRSSRVSVMRWVCVVTVGAMLGCGSGNSVESGKNAEEAKNNMSVPTKPGGEDSAPAKSVATTAPVAKPVVLFFGTSLTAGYGLDPSQAFPSLIERKAETDSLPITAVNAGLSGETTAGAARRIEWVLRTPADIVVIEGGANDALRGLSPDAARANIERVIAVIKQRQPQAKIVLVQMEAPPNYGPAYTRSFRTIYTDIAKREGVPLVPFLLAGVAGISRYNQADGVHPNLAGERIVADNIWRALKPIVAQLDRGAGRG
jgi:acyl-CoA thioesterase-1